MAGTSGRPDERGAAPARHGERGAPRPRGAPPSSSNPHARARTAMEASPAGRTLPLLAGARTARRARARRDCARPQPRREVAAAAGVRAAGVRRAERGELRAVAGFFVEEFFLGRTTDPTDRARCFKSLCADQSRDFSRRYGEQLPSST